MRNLRPGGQTDAHGHVAKIVTPFVTLPWNLHFSRNPRTRKPEYSRSEDAGRQGRKGEGDQW
jgi:hypothetical protein